MPPISGPWDAWFVNQSIICVRKIPDLRWKLSKVTKMGEAVARLPLKMKAKFLYQKDELSSPLLEKVKK